MISLPNFSNFSSSPSVPVELLTYILSNTVYEGMSMSLSSMALKANTDFTSLQAHPYICQEIVKTRSLSAISEQYSADYIVVQN
jgi:hypothetical protein